MRKLFQIWVVFCIALPVGSQDYFLPTMQWNIKITVEDGISYDQIVNIGKDSLVQGQSYHVINDVLMRQSGDSIFAIIPNPYFQDDSEEVREILLYNFGAEIGDSILVLGDRFSGVESKFVKVTKVDVVLLNDKYMARRIWYANTSRRQVDVEYVGDIRGGILGPFDNSMFTSELQCCSLNSQLLYERYEGACNNNPDMQLVSNASVSNEREKIISQDNHILIRNNNRIYTVMGKRIDNHK